MEIAATSFTARAHVIFTREEITILSHCAAVHYDTACKAAAQTGGLLYGMANRSVADEGAQHALTFRDLDLLAKIAEVAPALADEDLTAAARLQAGLLHAMQHLNMVTPANLTNPWHRLS